ncbi:LacI family DNA-binding transcriptional regulator [Paenibacillus koleovorans]|uniref:LacI family DNA-binding transcriptional regulator n=1 Tax=Paenibacillus koleovorans TaxID=121608 RepID=UPI000FDA6DD5|nr:LacI family DNA-binding transcriptional regulator [Paenibacillus koleovorans]
MRDHISMQQIADSLGVSKYTVSRSLAGKSGVSEETRSRVLELARSLGYRGAGVPIQSCSSTTGANIYSADDQSSKAKANADKRPFVTIWMQAEYREERMFWSKVLSGIEEGCDRMGWEPILLQHPDQRERPEDDPAIATNKHRWIGHIIAGECPAAMLFAWSRAGVPIVLVDHEEPTVLADCVVNANMQGGRWLAARLMLAGCRSIVFLGNDSHAVSFRDRWLGCKLELQEAGKRGEAVMLKKWTIPYRQRGWDKVLARKLEQAAEGGLPDAFIGANDDIALHALSLLTHLEIAVPDSCRVAGFDNIETAAHSSPSLTTVDFGKELLGLRAVEQLVQRRAHPARPAEKITVGARIIARQSG